ncbi:MAG: UDP-2,3-diacylglucosamine diphosphatase LpxI [Alphaproteobacteria bacterium]|nr:UDP-2,3-diacylglucosamine diphosphatase LpxI [Alphaproteobacteria bacterium]
MRAIFAGNGILPSILAHYITEKYHTAPLILTVTPDYDVQSLKSYSHHASDIGQLEECFAILKNHNCREVIFAGKIPRDYFYQTKKDALATDYFNAIQHKGDDYAVRFAHQLFQQHGFIVVAPHQICPDILCRKAGNLGKYGPQPTMLSDIARGQEILTALSPADVGQAVVIHQGETIGIEAIEGTNALIERCGAWLKQNRTDHNIGAVLVKLPKDGQTDMMDLPAIGLETVTLAIKHNFAGIAIEQNGTLLVGGDEIIQMANQHQLFIHALEVKFEDSA